MTEEHARLEGAAAAAYRMCRKLAESLQGKEVSGLYDPCMCGVECSAD